MRQYKKILLTTLSLLFFMSMSAVAGRQTNAERLRETYNSSHPVVYVDAWEKWPYAFVNDHGHPDGFNTQIVHEIFSRLNIPYEVKMLDQHLAHEEIKKGHAHFTFGVAAPYNEHIGTIGSTTVCYFYNSLFQPKSDSIGPLTVADLCNKHFYVNSNSRALYYARKGGVPDSVMTIVGKLEPEFLRIASEGKGNIVWNTIMLKWLVNKYHITGFSVTPLDIPPGEYRMIARDTLLLHCLDSVCNDMKREGMVDDMITSWMYPERISATSTIIPYLLLPLLIAVVLFTIGIIIVRRKKLHVRTLDDIALRMNLILHANKIKVWVYYPQTRRYAWMNRDGRINGEYNSFEFSKFFPGTDFNIIQEEVMMFVDDNARPPVVKNLRSYKLADRSTVLDVEVKIQTMCDDYGKVYIVCGIQHDITDSTAAIERMRVLHERYQSTFNISTGGIMCFDVTGTIIDVNERMLIRLGIPDRMELLDKKINISDLGIFCDIPIDSLPDDLCFCCKAKWEQLSEYLPFADFTHYNPEYHNHPYILTDEQRRKYGITMPEYFYIYVHFMKSYDAAGNFINYMIYLQDMTQEMTVRQSLSTSTRALQVLDRECKTLKARRDYALSELKIWMLRYYPDTKHVVFYDRMNKRMKDFTQLQVLEMVEGKYMKRLFRIFHRIDSGNANDIHISVGTLLRNSDGEQQFFRIDVKPQYGQDGKVRNYFGICTDITSHISVQRQLKKESETAHEAERLRQTFLRNMTFSIRQPLVAMLQSIEKLPVTRAGVDETRLLDSIKGNVRRLTSLSDDTLMLSRIQAGLVEPVFGEHDFVPIFRASVDAAIDSYRHSGVKYSVAQTYRSLILNIDPDAVSRIIREAVALSVRYTLYGNVYVRYMYHRGKLTIAIEDTSQGIPPATLEHIFEPHVGEAYVTENTDSTVTGLEMALCKALVTLLHGTIDIESDPVRGTVTYISLPVASPKSLERTDG